jgi:prevent-host-death family protein
VRTASAAKVAAQFYDYLEASREQPLLVTQNGKPVAVLVAVRDEADAEQLTSGRPRSLRSIFEEAHEQLQKGGGIPHDQFWREVEQARRARQPAPARAKPAEPDVAADRGPPRRPRATKSHKGRGR